MRTKRTSNAERRTPNIERRHDGLNFIFDVGSSEFDVRCFRSSRHSQRGVALVITLILLSVVTFMAITFLALSRRERSAVTTVTDTASARLAADAALANAEAQVIANVLSTTNPYNFSLLVSTNGWPLNFTNLPGDLTNLYVSPRVPVFISTNSAGSNDFRFYLDLNRNGRFESNSWVANLDNNGNIILDGGFAVTNIQVGDPEWIGVLERPDAPYGPNNKFVARYAFIALPIGNTLDLNAIHNQARSRALNAANDGYFRNQGVGSWEINLAAFLADLNTDVWARNALPDANYYQYNQPGLGGNRGAAFDDARALLAYRYSNNYNSLTNATALLNGAPGFNQDNIDGYSDGPLQTTFNTNADFIADIPALPWAGADNTNHYFTPSDLFDPNKTEIGVTPPGFIEHLQQAGNTNSTYGRYTFYRLLSQLGTDSTPESGKMNINYDNLDLYTNGVASSTNFMAWQPLEFFTNAADRLLRAYTTQWRNSNPTSFATNFYSVPSYFFTNANFSATNFAAYPAFGITNIPVWVSNRFVYSPAVNRLLQLAANIYDATTNSFYPSVFRPLFSRDQNGFGTNVFISGYTNVFSVIGPTDDRLALPIDASELSIVSGQVINLATNVYGVPWIIGAKKGFPNFNELTMENAFQLTRKMQVVRPNTNQVLRPISAYQINQMFILNITNQLGVECWNSYANSYSNSVTIYATEYLKSIILTNDEGFGTNLSFITTGVLPINNWPGYNPYLPNPSFQIPLNTSIMAITNSMYRFNSGSPYLTTNLALPYETGVSGYPQPHWWLMLTNNLRVIMLDTTVTPNRVIDYVQLRGPNSIRDLTAEIQTLDTPDYTGFKGLWETNYNNGVPAGLANQFGVSLGLHGTGSWGPVDLTQVTNEINGFRVFYGLGALPPFQNSQYGWAASTNAIQAPYTPTANAVQHITWQANDPLVHYVAGDLNGPNASQLDHTIDKLTDENLGVLNQRYMPWGGNPLTPGADQYPVYSAIKDPLVRQSDDWDFPANKFPGVGWLGRVHRGTPWQTVYLKASDVLNLIQITGSITNYVGDNIWMAWTGNRNVFDATNAAPVQDRLLFDLFTTTFNDNATRGQLPINVGPTNANLAAWSALFSGVMVLSNNAIDATIVNPQHANSLTTYGAFPVEPAGGGGVNSALGRLVSSINQTRANTNLFPMQTFTHVGDILSVPQLTDQSPFLRTVTNGIADVIQQQNGISDEMYEWLPQQTMSLLRVSGSPRYVIYCYGQALKPAPNSIYTGGGQFFGMVTNYQVVSEIATRAVVRFNSTVTNNVVFDLNTTNWVSQPVMTNNNAVIESFNLLPPD